MKFICGSPEYFGLETYALKNIKVVVELIGPFVELLCSDVSASSYLRLNEVSRDRRHAKSRLERAESMSCVETVYSTGWCLAIVMAFRLQESLCSCWCMGGILYLLGVAPWFAS